MRYRTADAGNGYTLEARIHARSAVLEGEVHDLAADALTRVKSPTLLIVGGLNGVRPGKGA